MTGRKFFISASTAVAMLLTGASSSHAFSGGIGSPAFGVAGCASCHSGGVVPDVILSGPTVVEPGQTIDYTVTVFGTGGQNFAGFNAGVPVGALATGGPFSDGTRTVTGLLGLVEITHSEPKQGDFMNVAEFSIRWTAPSDLASTTLRAWGSAVNHNGLPVGDAAAVATLEISAATPKPTPSPTPVVCFDAVPPVPAIVTDPAARNCRESMAKNGALYIKKDLRAVRSCLKDMQRGLLSGDPVSACVGTDTTLPTDAKTATSIGKAQTKVRKRLGHDCSAAALALLDACADTESDLGDCFLTEHRRVAIEAVGVQYGAVGATADLEVQKCQTSVGNAASTFLTADLKAVQGCLLKRYASGDGAQLCIGSLADEQFIPPTDSKAAVAIAAAEADLAGTISDKCDDAQLAVLGACGSGETGAIACLLCSHRRLVFDLLAGEFGGAP